MRKEIFFHKCFDWVTSQIDVAWLFGDPFGPRGQKRPDFQRILSPSS